MSTTMRDCQTGTSMEVSLAVPTIKQLFEILFPITWLQDVLLEETNKHLSDQVSYGEFLRWIGLCFLMSTTHFGSRRGFWFMSEQDTISGAPFWMNEWMSCHRFEAILGALQFTNVEPPSYKDCFWEVWQMLEAWNNNMMAQFIASWISCLDESLSKWVNEFTCPGYMCVP